jgi:DtxR family Mn-dependent transcriptional regulator
VSALIDATEMYLRTLFELGEEGVVPLRARLAERLHQSVPTVSETVARLQRQDLVRLTPPDNHIALTPKGETQAVRVMRKHRLAECLLIDVLRLPWQDVHEEACRWEHVISDEAERRIHALLGHPTRTPYGTEIPGLDILGLADDAAVQPLGDEARRPVTGPAAGEVTTLAALLARPEPAAALRVLVRQLDEPLQQETSLLSALSDAGVSPGTVVAVTPATGGVRLTSDGGSAVLPGSALGHLLVTEVSAEAQPVGAVTS